MRLLLILLMLFSFSAMSSAQGETAGTNSGNSYVNPAGLFFGGAFSFTGSGEKHFDSNGSENGPKSTSFSILPQTAYVLNRMLALGITLGYVSSAYKIVENISNESFELKDSQGEFIVQPNLAYYVNVMSRLYIFATLYVGFGFGNYTNQYVDFNNDTGQFERVSEKSKISSFRTGIALGFVYFVASQWALTMSYGNLYFNSTTEKHPDDANQKWRYTSYGLDLTLTTLTVGVLFYLAGNR